MDDNFLFLPSPFHSLQADRSWSWPLYVLGEDGHPRLCSDPRVWQEFFEDPDRRRVAITELETCTISTVFLCIDHNLSRPGPPLLFETRVFSPTHGEIDGHSEQYSTRADALEGHAAVVRVLKFLSARIP